MSKLEEPEGGNSYEVAVHKEVDKEHKKSPDQEWWKVTEVLVRTGNPHIKEYKVKVSPSGPPQ